MGDDGQQARQPLGRLGGALGQNFESLHDEGVAGENRQRLPILQMDGGLAAPHVRIIEAGEIVMDEGGAMQQLDGSRRRVRRCGVHIAAGHGHRQAELGPDAMPARENRVMKGRGQQRRRARALRGSDGLCEGLLDAVCDLHGPTPSFVILDCQM